VTPGTHPPDDSLSARLVAGDEAAFALCYRSLAPRVRTYLGRFVPPQDVDDLTQLAFLDLWRGRAALADVETVEPWLLTIARRRAIDHLRRRRPTAELAALDGRRTEIDLGEIDRVAERLAYAASVRRALARLGPDQRQVLELAYFRHRTQSEIAAELGLPLGTVKARSARALRRLAALIVGDDLGPNAAPVPPHPDAPRPADESHRAPSAHPERRSECARSVATSPERPLRHRRDSVDRRATPGQDT